MVKPGRFPGLASSLWPTPAAAARRSAGGACQTEAMWGRRDTLERAIDRAAEALAAADAVLVATGAGMGVDSGLPDFRGEQGFWRAYPPMKKLGLSFYDLADPRWFRDDPTLAWGFYGHRLNLYRATRPHRGFTLLRDLAGSRPLFAFTSNVDGQHQAAGWTEEQVFECHGSLRHLQCLSCCTDEVWSAEGLEVTVDEATFRATGELPRCPRCTLMARPNVLMFGDFSWSGVRSAEQNERYRRWLGELGGGALAVVELGAGTAVPSVRWQSESLASRCGATLIRVNPREAQGPRGTISIAAGALDAMEAIAARSSSTACLSPGS